MENDTPIASLKVTGKVPALAELSSAETYRNGWTKLGLRTADRTARAKSGKLLMFLFLLLAFSSANTQVGKVTPLMTKDLPDVSGKEGLLITVDFAPGEVVVPHQHNAGVFVYVLEGSIITQLEGGRPQTIHAGEAFYESPLDVHIASRNASTTQPAKLLVFFVKTKGVPPTMVLGKGNASH